MLAAMWKTFITAFEDAARVASKVAVNPIYTAACMNAALKNGSKFNEILL